MDEKSLLNLMTGLDRMDVCEHKGRGSQPSIFFGMKTRAPPKAEKQVCHEWIDVIVQIEKALFPHVCLLGNN